MPTTYARVRRQHRTIETKRDLHALWRSERLESQGAIEHTLRVYEMAIRLDGWQVVAGWARAAITAGEILNAQLVELAMRALEEPDDDFLIELVNHLLATSPPSYFEFWYALFAARHSHRGERLFRAHLAGVSDYHLVKYRRWVKKIFRKLRFRCRTAREKAIGAIAFAMYRDYDASSYPSEIFAQYIKAHDVARSKPKTKQGKSVPPGRHSELVAEALAPLRMWSIAEGIRTSHGLPRTLRYLSVMAPTLSDVELRRALKAFDRKLLTADHKKASELVTETAAHITERLRHMDLPIEEWAKIYPYQKSPILARVLEQILGDRLDAAVGELAPRLAVTPVPIADSRLDARGFRCGFLAGYLLHRADLESVAYIAGPDAAHALSHPSSLWPYGVGAVPPVRRFAAEPDHRHRVGFDTVRTMFAAVAAQRSPSPASMDTAIRCLRAQLRRRLVIDGEVSAADVPVLFLPGPPDEEERAALISILEHFSAAVLALFEQRWDPPLDAPRAVHLELSRDLGAATEQLVAGLERAAEHRAAFAPRKASIDRAARELLLCPPDLGIQPVLRTA
jgi:hypothetical protein